MLRAGECESLELKEVNGTRHAYLQVTSMSRKLKVMEMDTLRDGVETKTQRRCRNNFLKDNDWRSS